MFHKINTDFYYVDIIMCNSNYLRACYFSNTDKHIIDP